MRSLISSLIVTVGLFFAVSTFATDDPKVIPYRDAVTKSELVKNTVRNNHKEMIRLESVTFVMETKAFEGYMFELVFKKTNKRTGEVKSISKTVYTERDLVTNELMVKLQCEDC